MFASFKNLKTLNIKKVSYKAQFIKNKINFFPLPSNIIKIKLG